MNIKCVAVARLSDVRLQLWIADEQGRCLSCWKTAIDPNADWTVLSDFLGEVGQLPAPITSLAVAPLSDGRLQLWAADASGRLFTTWKVDTDPNANWSGWSDFLGEVGQLPAPVTSLAVAPLSDGRLQLWAADASGRLFTTWKVDTDPNANWSGWSDFLGEVGQLPAPITSLAVAPLSDGALQLWAADAHGRLLTTWKVDINPNANWSGWSDFLGEVGQVPAPVTSLAVAPLSDGALQLWAADAHGRLFTTWKVDTNPSANWSGWSDFLGEVGRLPAPVTSLAVAPLSDRRLELWAADANGGLFTTWKVDTNPSANWSGWSDFLDEVQATLSVFTGTATFTIADTRFPGPFMSALTLSAFFSRGGRVELTAFPTITVGPFNTPIGTNTITVTMVGGGVGTFVRSTGAVTLPITLHFNHSLPDVFVGDSNVSFNLTTGSTASPTGAFRPVGTPLIAATGAIVLVGASAFRGGFLAGTDCAVVVAGTLAPIP